MSGKVKKAVSVNKKNDGQEVNIQFEYLASKDIDFTTKTRIEQWVRTQADIMLGAFKVQFPGVRHD